MARSKTGKGAYPTRIARARALPQVYPGPFTLSTIQDNRSWHPAGPYRAPLSLLGTPRPRIDVPQKQRFAGKRAKLHQLAFQAPATVLVCVRRRRRKEVLFATKRAGAGNRKGKRNYWSKISCRS